MRSLAIIWYSMTGGSKALAQAAAKGAASADGVAVQLINAKDAGPDILSATDCYLFVFPENLAAINGEMKAFFDRSYYPCLGQIEGRSYALIVCAGSDGSNAARQAERIATGWRLRRVAESMIICTNAQTPEAILARKILTEVQLAAAHNLGKAMAEGLALGVF
jgi:multimeric flavodoxin WrbA